MRLRSMLAVAVLALGIACGGSSGGGSSCPDDVPAQCPASPPSWSGQVSAIVADRCATCHAPGGVEASRSFTTWQGVHAQSSRMLSQVAACRMPPPDAAAPTNAERAALLQWLVCGAPDN